MITQNKFICPHCGADFHPYGAFMLEKIYCPVCGNAFHILKFARTIRIIYAVLSFIALAAFYNYVKPHTSVMITIFWLISLLALKLATYVTHYVLLLVWNIWYKNKS